MNESGEVEEEEENGHSKFTTIFFRLFFSTIFFSTTRYIQESVLPNFFSLKTEDFFHFSLLSLSVCSIRKYCLYFKMAEIGKTKKSKFGRIDSR
jgi:hypothetical protein